jgi:hypothetical protein
MKSQRIAQGINMVPLLWALHENPQLWDENAMRTQSLGSPHHGLHDIWARYAAPEVAHLDGLHESVWYPAADVLPLREIVYPLMAAVRGEQLGGVLITKIPPGAICRPHVDQGWHARYYEKFGVQVQASPGQAFCFDGEELVSRPGDVFWFDNSHRHWVTNNSPHDRITMIVCIKTDWRPSCLGA